MAYGGLDGYRENEAELRACNAEINGTCGNMAVVVNMRNNQYKVHRILMPNGSIFKFDEVKKIQNEKRKGECLKTGLLPMPQVLYLITVYHKILKSQHLPRNKKNSAR